MVYMQETRQARAAQAQGCVGTVEDDSCTVTRGMPAVALISGYRRGVKVILPLLGCDVH